MDSVTVLSHAGNGDNGIQMKKKPSLDSGVMIEGLLLKGLTGYQPVSVIHQQAQLKAVI